MKKYFLLVSFISLYLFSCQEDRIFSISNENAVVTKTGEEENQLSRMEKDPNYDLKVQFSKALAQVLAESKEARELIKNEALKKIDYDYDVLYDLIKNVNLSNGNTLESLLLHHLDAGILAAIKEKIPTLTIFVPTLPENTFSAALWDIENEIPEVAFRTSATNDIPSYDSNGTEDIIESRFIPGYPIVVIKENERIVANTNSINSNRISLLEKASTGNSFSFLSEAFDNVNHKTKEKEIITKANYTPSVKEQKIFEAFDVFPNASDWQRDYVYYNLTPTQTKGAFDLRYKEHIVGFEMLGNAKSAMNKIADHTADPRIDGGWHERNASSRMTGQMTGWTDGEFEFRAKYCLGGKSPVAAEVNTYFRVDPMDLFNVKPKKNYNESKNKFEIQSVTALYAKLTIPMFEWNIENYSAIISLTIEEVDLSETVRNTTSIGAKVATNFNYEASWGDVVKNGLKFGGSKEDNHTVSYETVTQTGSDDLGTVIINFGDQIILSKDTKYFENQFGSGRSATRPDYNDKYYTGWYRVHIAPLLAN